jgi:hypothetical protein
MKRGHIILIAGAVLLAAGITIASFWAISFAGSFVTNNTLIGKTIIDGGRSVSIQNHVTQLDEPISLTLGIDKTAGGGQLQQPSATNTRVRETVTDPSGRVVSTNEFSDSFVTSFKPDVAGIYTVTMTNLGTNSVSASGTFGYLPFAISNNDCNQDTNTIMGGEPARGLGMIIVGAIMAVAGVVMLIVGGIITVMDARTRQDAGTSSDGGLTYRSINKGK